jgi:hypothetical protein
VFGHIAFWDARILALAAKLKRGAPFTPSDTEPEDVDWINDASRPLIHAIPPRQAAGLALRIAEETDAVVATLPVERTWPTDPVSPIYAFRSSHRAEHLARGRGGPRTAETKLSSGLRARAGRLGGASRGLHVRRPPTR